jgi:hypothetical protein
MGALFGGGVSSGEVFMVQHILSYLPLTPPMTRGSSPCQLACAPPFDTRMHVSCTPHAYAEAPHLAVAMHCHVLDNLTRMCMPIPINCVPDCSKCLCVLQVMQAPLGAETQQPPEQKRREQPQPVQQRY